MRTLALRLKRHSMSPESGDGFILERVRDHFIEGKYFEKITIDDIVRDPFGNERIFERIDYREVEFVFSSKYPQIELHESPRGLQPFLSRLSEASDFSLSLLALEVDLFKWANVIGEAFPSRFRIESARLSDLVIEEGVTARVLLSSQRDIRDSVERFTARRRHLVDKIQLTLEHDGAPWSLHLSAGGTLRSRDTLPA